VTAVAVRWYLRYGLSYGDVEEVLCKRGITMDHAAVYRGAQRFSAEFVDAARPCRRLPSDRWLVDETHVKFVRVGSALVRPGPSLQSSCSAAMLAR
jgi:transposase-like protein